METAASSENMIRISSQAKLTRTHSSLLRSSPTIRSSIHSLSSVNELTVDQEGYGGGDIEEQKLHSKPGLNPTYVVRTGSSRFGSVVLIFLVFVCILFVFFNRDDIPTSENVLLVLIFIAVILFLVQRNKGLIYDRFNFVKQFFDQHAKKLGFSKNQTKPVKWFIGESVSDGKTDRKEGNEKIIVREGVEVYSNGDLYEGEFHRGRCTGSGVYNYFANGRYEGDWIDGRYDGYGIESWARGSRYRGQYKQGLRHGYGVYRFYTGDTYAGQWCNGQSHGLGVQTCSDGSCYIGEFKAGVKHGRGVYNFRNGDRYAGEYFGDKIHGFGVYRFANGHFYEGSWHEGRKQGYGMYTFRNGDVRCGEWNSGNLQSPSNLQMDGVIRAVQAARRTADNAFQLPRIDEQVNRAVAAANRAANAARVAAIKAVQNRVDGKFCDTTNV